MEGQRIVQTAADAIGFEVFFQAIAPPMAHHVEMPCALGIISLARQLQRRACQQFMVALRHPAPFARPMVQVLELHAQHRALKPFHTVVESDLIVVVTPR